jgi:hypothetical protein
MKLGLEGLTYDRCNDASRNAEFFVGNMCLFKRLENEKRSEENKIIHVVARCIKDSMSAKVKNSNFRTTVEM